MTLLKCKMCGGDVELFTDKTIGVCASCGCTSTLPRLEDEQKVSLFNRGNTLRMRGEFDKAAAVFERIIEQDETDAEAHWCLALCRFGIEYVEDPKSGVRIPTCHRTSYNLFSDDVDYMCAVEHSDSNTASLYQTAALKIAEIQRAILDISKQEDPFDVFICYKETMDGGDRTKDSALAQDIYYELTNVGYKVFFSRITLEEKLGLEYEPYIFAALNSAKVMIVVGTSADNFNAVWVKNEWNRFLSLMKADRGRMLIPCYCNMDPYDLPDELAMLQSQDMSKIGFIQDITRGIKKILESEITQKESKTIPEKVLDRLIKNSNTYLQLNNYPAAQEVFNRITKEYPEDYRGWWGLIVCETKGFSVVIEDISPLNIWFQYVKQLSKQETFASLETDYLPYIKLVAHSDAAKKISIINQTINSSNANIEAQTKCKNQAEDKKKNTERTYDQRIFNCSREIKEAQMKLHDLEQPNLRDNLLIIGSVVILIVGFFLFIYCASISHLDGFLTLISIACIVLGIRNLIAGISYSKGHQATNEKAADAVNQQLKHLYHEKEELINQYDTEILMLNKKTEKINFKIAQAEKKITICKKYLEHGKDKISKAFFAEKCKILGINQEVDADTEWIRSAVFDQEANDSENFSSDDKGLPYEITCSFCGSNFSVSEKVLNSVAANCPTCGAHLELDTE